MNLSKRKFLEMAIYQEIATRDFYLQVSQRIQDRGGKRKFLDLSEILQKLIEFENNHYLLLKEEHEAISKNFYWI
jgi:rubrerythrin